MREISEETLDRVAARLEARLEYLREHPKAYKGNVACFAQAQERRRISRQEAVGNVVYVGREEQTA